MNRYDPSTPRVALGATAVAAAALTLGVLVLLPVELSTAGSVTLAAASANEPHVDTGRATLAATDAQARRHELVARLITNVQDAGLLRLAGSRTTRSDR
jgi:hypothetical protein